MASKLRTNSFSTVVLVLGCFGTSPLEFFERDDWSQESLLLAFRDLPAAAQSAGKVEVGGEGLGRKLEQNLTYRMQMRAFSFRAAGNEEGPKL